MSKETLKIYYRLTKPGIIYGNLLTTLGGFFLASANHIDVFLLVATMLGISLIIGSACVFNNYIDRGIDEKMARTKNRALVTGVIPPKHALIFGVVLGLIGFALLIITTNFLTVFLGILAMFDYVVLYGISKRGSIHGTVIGSIAGALPPVAGYTAVTDTFDMGAGLLFLILTLWQMPHFYAIAIYRLKDYQAAHIPVLPAVKGIRITKIHMLCYVIAFTILVPLLTVYEFTKYTYLVSMLILSMYWIYLCIKGFFVLDDTKWAKGVFRFSLILILSFSLLLIGNVVLP